MKIVTNILGLFLVVSLFGQGTTRGLVVHYPLDNHMRDVSGNKRDAAASFAPMAATDRFGNSCGAVHLNGKDEVITIPDFFVNASFTVSAWFRPEKQSQNKIELLLLSQMADDDVNSPSLLNVQYAQRFFDASSGFSFSTSQSGDDKNYQNHRLESDKWCFFAMTYDDGWAYAYVNGKLVGQIFTTKSVRSNNQPLMIGRDAAKPNFFKGDVDDVKIFDRALLPNELMDLYTDDSGKNAKDVFTMKTSDDLKLSSDSGKCYATLKFFPPTVNLNCGSYELKQVSGIPSGSLFNVGKTYNRFQATASDGRIITGEFVVEVVDAQNPSIQCPADVYVKAPAGARVMPVKYPGVKVSDNCDIKSVEKLRGLSSSAYFPIGKTEIEYQATDSAGNKSACTFNVFVEVPEPPKVEETAKEEVAQPVVDNKTNMVGTTSKPNPAPIEQQKPTAVTPQTKTQPGPPVDQLKITKEEAAAKPSPTSAEVSKQAIAETAKPAEPIKTVTKPSPGVVVSEVPKAKPGNQVEVFGDGSAAKSKVVFPIDMSKPSEAGKCGATLVYKAPRTENGKEVEVKQTKGKPSGSFFPVGVTENAFYAYDQSGSVEYFFNVVINDEEPPVLLDCPKDTIVKLPYGRRGLNFLYSLPRVKDNCGVDSIAIVTGSKSGCFLPLGAHPFVLEAKDKSGNATQCSFEVLVVEDEEPSVVTAPTQLAKHLNLGTDTINYEHKIEVNDCFLTIVMYDDGEEDNDSVSIIFNGTVLVNHEMIRVKENGVIQRELVLGSNMQNYLIAKAWNTGRYGSNTLRIDVYEGNIDTDRKDFKKKKPIVSKILHSRPGIAGGILLNCAN